MSTIQSQPQSRFLRRFDDIWSRLRRVNGLKALSSGVLIALIGFTALVICDFCFELPLSLRRIILPAVILSAVFVAFSWVLSIVRWWNADNTAAEIERSFPELGQSVRTAIEFGRMSDSDLERAGIAPSLVQNLQSQTDRKTLALDLPKIIRTGALIASVGIACFLTGSLVTGSAVNGEWKTAVQRSLMSNVPYTTVESTSGTMTVIQGQPALLTLDVAGRVDRDTQLFTRQDVKGAEWTVVAMTEAELKDSSKEHRRYEVQFSDVQVPFEYRFKAGPASTDTHAVTVRFPLEIQGYSVTVTPPAYTRLPDTVVEEPSFTAIDGSHAKISIQLDREPVAATLLMRPAGTFAAAGAEAKEIPLQINGSLVSTEMQVTDNWRYVFHAVDSDGVELKTEDASIRVRRDQAPRVWFEKPTEELEVHTLAEIIMRVRASDDFGLANAGIVFEINNESSHTLMYQDFAKALAEATEKDSATATILTNTVLEEMLPLEFFELTQRDSVSYFAFAEDNYPEAAHRMETELRFIDIRPFRQRYELYDMEDPMGPPGGEDIMFLGDLIRRERALLNRTIRVANRVQSGGAPETDTTNALIEEQQIIADGTKRFAEFLIARQFGGEELIYEAHEAMLAAITSLGDGRFDDAEAQERDAIKLLVEGRDVLRILIRKNPPKNRAALRAFSRKEAQKLRRPKSDEQELMELIERLTQLAKEERQVSTSLAICMNPGGTSGSSGQSSTQGQNGSSGASGMPNDETTQPDNPQDGDDAQVAKSEEPSDSKDTDSLAGEPKTDKSSTDELRRETEERQHSAALEARDIESKMSQIPLITELARTRMADAAKMAESAAESLTRGDTPGAGEQVKQTEQMLGELRKQAEALLKEEISQRIAAARDLANQLAQQQSQLQSQLNQQSMAQGQNSQSTSGQSPMPAPSPGANGGTGSGNQKPQSPEEMQAAQDALEQAAGQLAETGRTLQDVLKAIANSDRQEDQESAAQVARVMEEQQLDKQVDQMQQMADQIGKSDFEGAQAAAGELSERLQVTAQELEQVHRGLIAPRLAQLMKLEKMALALVEKLKQLETTEDVAAWHREAQELLDEMDKNLPINCENCWQRITTDATLHRSQPVGQTVMPPH